jgi:hypothetical protein
MDCSIIRYTSHPSFHPRASLPLSSRILRRGARLTILDLGLCRYCCVRHHACRFRLPKLIIRNLPHHPYYLGRLCPRWDLVPPRLPIRRSMGIQVLALHLLCILGFDRVVRIGRMLKNGMRKASFRPVGDEILRVDIEGVKWNSAPGQHAWENHPFPPTTSDLSNPFPLRSLPDPTHP